MAKCALPRFTDDFGLDQFGATIMISPDLDQISSQQRIILRLSNIEVCFHSIWSSSDSSIDIVDVQRWSSLSCQSLSSEFLSQWQHEFFLHQIMFDSFIIKSSYAHRSN